MTNISDLYNLKKAEMANYIKMAKADGQMIEAENMLLRLIAHKLEITKADFDEIYENPEKYIYMPPVDEKGRITHLFVLIQLMRVDLKMSDEEIHIYKQMGSKLFIPDQKVNDVLQLLQEQPRGVIEFEEVKGIIERYF